MPGGESEGKDVDKGVAEGSARGDTPYPERAGEKQEPVGKDAGEVEAGQTSGAEESQAAQALDVSVGEKQQSTEEEMEPVEESQTPEFKEDTVAESSVASVTEKQESDEEDIETMEDNSAFGAEEGRSVDVPVESAVMPTSEPEVSRALCPLLLFSLTYRLPSVSSRRRRDPLFSSRRSHGCAVWSAALADPQRSQRRTYSCLL
jgi:hypothetical protein